MQRRKRFLLMALNILILALVLCFLTGCKKKLHAEHSRVVQLHETVFVKVPKGNIIFGTEDLKPEDIARGKVYLKMSETDYETLRNETKTIIDTDLKDLTKEKLDKLIAKLENVTFIVGTKEIVAFDDTNLKALAKDVLGNKVIFDASLDAKNISNKKFLYRGTASKEALLEKYNTLATLTDNEKKDLQAQLQAVKDALVAGEFTNEQAQALKAQVSALGPEVLADDIFFLNQDLLADELANGKTFIKGEPVLKEQLKSQKMEIDEMEIDDLHKDKLEAIISQLTNLKATKVIGTFNYEVLVNEIRVLVNELTATTVIFNEIPRTAADFPLGFSHVTAPTAQKEAIRNGFTALENKGAAVTKNELVTFKATLTPLTIIVGTYDYSADLANLTTLYNERFALPNIIYSEAEPNADEVIKGLIHIKATSTIVSEYPNIYRTISQLDPQQEIVNDKIAAFKDQLLALRRTVGTYDSAVAITAIDNLATEVLADNVFFEAIDKPAADVNLGFFHINEEASKKQTLKAVVAAIKGKALNELTVSELETTKNELTTLKAKMIAGTYNFQATVDDINTLKNKVLADNVIFGLEAKTAAEVMVGYFYIQEDPAKKAEYIARVAALSSIQPGNFIKVTLETLKSELQALEAKLITGTSTSIYTAERNHLAAMIADEIFGETTLWNNENVTAEQMVIGVSHVKTTEDKTTFKNQLLLLKGKGDSEFITDYNSLKTTFEAIKATYISGTYDHSMLIAAINGAESGVLAAIWHEEERDEDGMITGSKYIKGSAYEKEVLNTKVAAIKAQAITEYVITELEAAAALVNEYNAIMKEGTASLTTFTYTNPAGYTVEYEVVSFGIVYIKKMTYNKAALLERIDIPKVIVNKGLSYEVGGLLADATADLKNVKIVDLSAEDNSNLSFIGRNNFQNIPTLEHVFLPTSIEFIGEGFLDGCTAIKTTEHNGLKYLDNDTAPELDSLVCLGFNTTALAVVNLHENTRVIVAGAFKDQTVITEVKINPLLVHIGVGAFAGTTNLTLDKIQFKHAPYLKYIADHAFQNAGVTNIKASDVPSSTIISRYACK